MRTPRHPTRGLACPSETKRLGDSEFVLVSFWGGVIVVEYRRACVEEDERDDGRENVARFRVLERRK